MGKQQHYKLGKWFRNRYQERLFPHGYSVDKVHILSTSYDRAIMSAGANLAGLFPPTGNQTWNLHLPWQPMPIHTVSKAEDTALYPSASENPCPLHQKLLDEYSAPFYQKYAQTFSYTALMSGLQNPSSDDIVNVYDSLKVEKLRNLK